ncbi:hypothetical protein AXF42_Ash001708 [Apostasia shenzhenica]|uniref:S-adenosyl-L-methionine-dependent methyltransferase n=1 Tax=Apostasia shenzhenica TaxID=1088818 RepID=A0A2I0AB00_9ASPA|nr:hypothetical protein AXF42_Ash001708 [Apostasia shenzhenica]
MMTAAALVSPQFVCYGCGGGTRSCSLPLISFIPRRKRGCVAGVTAGCASEGFDSNLESAISAAYLRFQESLLPDPIFIDPYAKCLLSQDKVQDSIPIPSTLYFKLATKFIDDKILSEMSSSQELRQIVLLTDGMDTRPFRLNWPRSTVIYDISLDRVFKEASQRLHGIGAKISNSCLLIHVPLSSDLHMALCRKGFNGSKPSLWALQGLSFKTLAGFIDMLDMIGSLTMKGCLFVGELPVWLLNSGYENMLDAKKLLEKLFLKHGFQVNVVDYDEMARNLHRDLPKGYPVCMVFVAKQLRFSDAQMDLWRTHFQRIEEEGNEEGFEEL